MSDDPFSVLGLDSQATIAQVRAARRVLAQQAHPDRGGDPVRMQEINAAVDAAVRHITQRPRRIPNQRPVPDAATPSQAQPRQQPRPQRRIQRDEPSFTIDALPAVAFETLLVATSWMGQVLVDDPPYLLEVHLDEPFVCWCRLDVVPDAGGSTVSLTVAAVEGAGDQDVELVRDHWVDVINRLGELDNAPIIAAAEPQPLS